MSFAPAHMFPIFFLWVLFIYFLTNAFLTFVYIVYTKTYTNRAESEKKCGQPRFQHCKYEKWWGWWECEAWAKCMGYISSFLEKSKNKVL